MKEIENHFNTEETMVSFFKKQNLV
jgi:hypothetical protein